MRGGCRWSFFSVCESATGLRCWRGLYPGGRFVSRLCNGGAGRSKASEAAGVEGIDSRPGTYRVSSRHSLSKWH